jgi:hypothetical protein
MTATRDRSKARTLAVVALLALAGCNPRYVASVNGLVDGPIKPEPFDESYTGEWHEPTWERVLWKVERLLDSDSYFVTHFDDHGQPTFYTATVLEVADMTLIDMQEAPGEGKGPRPHLLAKVELSRPILVLLGYKPPEVARKHAALGGGAFLRYRSLKLQPMRGRYFLDHPDLVAHEKTFDDQGQAAGPRLTASAEELRAFFEAHAKDDGLWVDDENALKLEAKPIPKAR